MAAYAWARSRSLFSRILPTKIKPVMNQEVEISQSNEMDGEESTANKRFLSAIKDGGIFLS